LERQLKGNPDLSIIVTCYNKREFIADCINSILYQDFQNYEMIVVDDGSTDGSFSIVKEFSADPKVKAILSNHAGVSAARNLGIKNATGNILLFLDGDCLLEDGTLSKLLCSIKDIGADCVGGELRAINDCNSIAKTVELMQNEVQRKWPFGAFVAYKREAVEKAGGFDEHMKAGEDVGFFLAVKKLGFKCAVSSEFGAKTVNPESFFDFLRQRFVWGMGFAQLTEKHKETFTKRIKLCFILSFLVLTSPLLILIDAKLIFVFLTLLTLDLLRFVPQAIRIARRAADKTHSLLIPPLRFLNSLAYFFGWSYWKIFELLGKNPKLKAFN